MKRLLTCLLALAMLTALTVPAMAAEDDFVLSIELKPGPGIVEDPADSGNGGIIIMPDGTEIIVPVSEIIITPISGKDAADEHIKNALEDAFADASGAASLDELAPDFQDILDKNANGVKSSDVVIKDMFHVDLTGDYKKHVEAGGVLYVTFDVTTTIPVILSKTDAGWAVITDGVTINADGTVTIAIRNIGVYTFLKDVSKVDVDPEQPGVSSPTTGDFTMMYVTAAAVLFVISGIFFAVYKKQTV